MNHEDAFLRAICEEPWEDSHRLVFADWLSDHGEEDRASFIRAQCRLAAPWEQCAGGGECWQCHCQRNGWQHTNGTCRCAPAWKALRRRGRELLNEHRKDWMPSAFFEAVVFGTPSPEEAANYLNGARWCRGFLEVVSLPLADFMTHADALFRAAPLTGVRLTDRSPLPAEGGWWWFDRSAGDPVGRCILPAALWNFLPAGHFDAESEALDALSAACVSWGRTLAGLPPLPQPATGRVH